MIIVINPNIEENIPKFLNESIEKNLNEKYLMFVFNDLYEQLINKDVFFEKYCELLKEYDLPFAFYPYYIHFNKVLSSNISLANPKMRVSNKRLFFDVINQTSYGMLIIDIEKLKSINFKFNESYKKAFYMQELIEVCFEKKLYFSNSWFIDVFKSFDLVKSNMKDGYKIDPKIFMEEKAKFFSVFKQTQPESGNDFIGKIREHYFSEKKNDENNNQSLNITVNGVNEIK